MDEAKSTATSELDSWWENGTLVEGDRGSVSDGGEILCLKDVGEAKLREFNQQRTRAARAALLHATEEAAKAGYTSLADVLPDESKPTMVGYYLREAGEILDASWSRYGIVYDCISYSAGFSEDRIKELMKTPETFWFVECVVG